MDKSGQLARLEQRVDVGHLRQHVLVGIGACKAKQA
jgi:hypothetical protein